MGAILSGGLRMQTTQRPILERTSPALSVACTGRSNCASGSMVAILHGRAIAKSHREQLLLVLGELGAVLALWGNKNWPPSMKVKKMEIF